MKRKTHFTKKAMLLLLACAIMANWLLMPEYLGGQLMPEVSAKVSASTRKKALKTYRRALDESDYRYFFLMDIDKDGMKELVVSYESKPGEIMIEKYRKGLVYRVGEDYAMWGYRYNKKAKCLYGSWANRGSAETWSLTVTKKGKLKRVYLSMIEERVVNGKPVYGYYYAGKKISRKAYLKKKKSWNKNSVPLKMHRMSSKNIKKYVR